MARKQQSSSQPSNRRGYSNKPAPGFTSPQRQLKLTEAFAQSDKEKVPFNGTIEQELELYKILFPPQYPDFAKARSNNRRL